MSTGDTSATAGVPQSEPRPRSITCEFCECTLFTSGEVKKKSDKARKMEAASDRLEKIDADAKEAKEKADQAERDRIARETSQHAPPDASATKAHQKFRVL